MSVKVKISEPGDAFKLIDAVRRAWGINVTKMQMEVKGKTVNIDLRKPQDPVDRLYEGGRP